MGGGVRGMAVVGHCGLAAGFGNIEGGVATRISSRTARSATEIVAVWNPWICGASPRTEIIATSLESVEMLEFGLSMLVDGDCSRRRRVVGLTRGKNFVRRGVDR